MTERNGKNPDRTRSPGEEGFLRTVHLLGVGAFSDLCLELSPGLNVLTGMNGTGKSQFLTFVRAGLTANSRGVLSNHFSAIVLRPKDPSVLLLHRSDTSRRGSLILEDSKGESREFVLHKGGRKGGVSVSQENADRGSGGLRRGSVLSFPDESVSWEPLSGKLRPSRSALVRQVEKVIPGRVCFRNGSLWIKNGRGWSRWGQVSPASRQLGLLSLFLRQGALVPGSILLWDSPEGVFGPLLLGDLASLCLSLSRRGVQVVVATRDYVFLKEVDLWQKDNDGVRYHAFFRDDRLDKICTESSPRLSGLSRNPASDALRSLLDRDIERAMDSRWSP
ncbi:MAG: ATP-binding protein [Nitrospirae bacterium]|nr:ATP-binding protein [Nitrospirota bacterium]